VAVLLGAIQACASKNDPIPSGKVGECARCHLPEFSSAPKHAGVKPTTCSICHSEESWHPTVTRHPWALTGAHEKTPCFDCHVGNPPVYHGTSKKCVDCHRKDYDRGHRKEDVATTCADCHSTDSWKHASKSKKQSSK
ncbi:MAG: cytochrome c3 family protein, partial [Polyangiales bacterium]